MKNFKVVGCILMIFLLGLACGALVGHMVYKSKMDSFLRGDRHKAREEMLLQRLSKTLDLDERQRAQVGGIIHETRGEMKKIRESYRPQMEAVLENSRNEVRKVLRPDQREKFECFLAERKPRWQEKR
jgi:Spy/CpxP family protein refolding chaperone